MAGLPPLHVVQTAPPVEGSTVSTKPEVLIEVLLVSCCLTGEASIELGLLGRPASEFGFFVLESRLRDPLFEQ